MTMNDGIKRRWLERVLRVELGLEGSADGEQARLALFQQTGLVAVESALSAFGGAILADEVGLGKTHVACAVLRQRGGGLVLAPASLLGMWEQRVAAWGLSACVTLASHTGLALGRLSGLSTPPIVVVDEAHAFGQPETHRYRALSRLALKTPLLLMTATPFGLDPMDLLHMLRLFLPTGSCRSMLGMSLESWLELARDSWPSVLRRVVIRRSRGFLRHHWPGGLVLPDGSGGVLRLTFPRRRTVSLSYSMDLLLERGLGGLAEAIEALDDGILGAPSGLLRTMLLSRLESSAAALDRSLGRLEGYLERRVEAVRLGRQLSRQAWQQMFGGLGVDHDRQQVFPFMFESCDTHNNGPTAAAIVEQLDQIRALRHRLRPLWTHDPKMEALQAYMRSLAPHTRVLIFTRFVETAEALYKGLAQAFPGHGVGLIHGAAARCTGHEPSADVPRRVVLERFVAGGEDQHRITVLVATDVLSEGLDLQVEGCVVSYDLPWNPRRLVQRFGRLDRLGPTERTIETVWIRPDRDLEVVLGVMRRLRGRLHDAEALVGGLEHWLDLPEGSTPSELRALPRDPRLDVEFVMRSDLLSVVQPNARLEEDDLPLGWRMAAAPRSPAGTLFLFDPMLPRAPLYWVFVPRSAEDGTRLYDRAVLYPRLRGLLRRPAQPLARAPARAWRLALVDALDHQQRLWSACLQPIVHPPASVVAQVLRKLSALPMPEPHDRQALQVRERLMALLSSPLPVGVVGLMEEGLAQEYSAEHWLEVLSPHLSGQSRLVEPKSLHLIGVVDFDGHHHH